MLRYDAVVIGAGAAGLHCAAIAGQRGLRVLLLDHAARVAEKIRISGGGRCNFTNRETGPENFLSANPDFCRSALARYTPQDFIALVDRHRIAWHEKHKGQLFCDGSSAEIIAMLLGECERGSVVRWQPCSVGAVANSGMGFAIETDRGAVRTAQLVIATGGLSIPQIGASDFGYRLARQFGHRMVETRPALVPLTLDPSQRARFAPLSGLSLPVGIETGSGRARGHFQDDLLFTHRGLSGPAVLQISTFWRPGAALRIDCTPTLDLSAHLLRAKAVSQRRLGSVLGELIPRRLSDVWLEAAPGARERPLAEMRDRELVAIAQGLQRWELTPDGTEGYPKAEVTAGGVDTRELDSQTLQSRRRPGLYVIGEVVDVTGWLGGYNFQWAWASAAACARALTPGASSAIA
ncbi:MAG TPA: NAD(P)/FAD-dependent oxidoreductase [Caldimonas sp.]